MLDGRAKPSRGGVNERRDGDFEVVLAFAQFISVRRTAEGADRLVGRIIQLALTFHRGCWLALGGARTAFWPRILVPMYDSGPAGGPGGRGFHGAPGGLLP